ncbi:MAG: SprT-like domain-containing protein [Bacteroidaceae bacterium]|nr:SprT-like domain-containing protein [Bacteroidaceae bacterium]
MTVTLSYIEQKFDEFNQLCFNGELSRPRFGLFKARNAMGRVKCYKEKRADGTSFYKQFSIEMNRAYDLNEQVFEDCIIHEMIHYYIISHQIQDTSPHGKVFRSMMNDINSRFDRHVNINYKMTADDLKHERVIHEHCICVMHMKDGRMTLAICAKSRVLRCAIIIQDLPNVADSQWFVSFNPFFNRFMHSTKYLHMYDISSEELNRHLADAVKLIRKGNIMIAEKEIRRPK